MLVLKRKPGESIWIAGGIKVTILKVDAKQVSVGVAAPVETKVLRVELLAKENAAEGQGEKNERNCD